MATLRKLGYLVPQFPGQTHIFFWREIRELESRGIDVHLLSTRRPPPGLISHDWSDAAMDRTTYLGQINLADAAVTLPRVPWGEAMRERAGRAFLRDVAITAPAAQGLIRYARAHDLDHVHVHSCGRAALIGGLARRWGGPSYSLTLHGPLQDYGPGQRFKWRKASFATIITQRLIDEMQAEMPEALPKRIFLQPMGVDTERFKRDTPYIPATPGQPLRLFSCGRLHFVKGHQDTMEAIRLLIDAGQAVHLEIAGEDDDGGSGYRSVLEGKIRDLNLSEHVTLLGAVDAETVRRKIIDAHAFVLASWAEPLGVALMESMSCGTPTISTRAGGVPELITDGVDGVLVPPKEPQMLADAITALVADSDRAQRLSDAGRARIVEKFHAGLGAETLIRGAEEAMAARA